MRRRHDCSDHNIIPTTCGMKILLLLLKVLCLLLLALAGESSASVSSSSATTKDLLPSSLPKEKQTRSSCSRTEKESQREGKKAVKKKKKKKSSSAPVPTSVRRILAEWKDAVQAGIGYDWKLGQPVVVKNKKKNRNGKRSTRDNDDDADNNTPQQQHIWLGPLDKNLWVWHFSVAGVANSCYEGGIYHGRVVLPTTYPAHAPRVQMLTASGRYVQCQDICLSASSYHPETWSPSQWSVRTLVEGIRQHMLTTPQEIGGIQTDYDERVEHAANSRSYQCWVQQRQRSSKSSEKTRTNRPIHIDHARMIQQGLFSANNKSKNNNEKIEEESKEENSDGEEQMPRLVEDQSQAHSCEAAPETTSSVANRQRVATTAGAGGEKNLPQSIADTIQGGSDSTRSRDSIDNHPLLQRVLTVLFRHRRELFLSFLLVFFILNTT